MEQQHDLVWDSLVFPCLDLGAAEWWPLCEWPTMWWSLVAGQGTWESEALEFVIQFLIVCSAFFEWLWLNSYGNAFS